MWPFGNKEYQCDIVRRESQTTTNELYKDINKVKSEHTELRVNMTSEITNLRNQDEKMYSELNHLVDYFKSFVVDAKKDSEKMELFREDVRTSIAKVHESNNISERALQKSSRLGWMMLGAVFTIVSSVIIIVIKFYIEK